jgi:hypothetical protein
MSYTWFRCYHEIIDDPKIGMMSDTDQLLWFKMMCLASADNKRGYITLTDEEIAFKLRCSEETFKHAKDKFRAKGLIEHENGVIKITNWEKRQHEKPSNSPEATRERKRRQRAESKKMSRDVTPHVTPLSRPCHATDTNPDSDSEPDSKNIQSTLPPSKNAHKTENQENAGGGREDATLLKEEEPRKPVANPLATLEKKTKAEFLKFCKQHYRQHNDGKELSLAQEYAKKYFDELWELYENTTGLQVDLEPEIKTEELAIAICEKYPCEEWPNWVLKAVGVSSKYFNQYEHWYMSSSK